MGWTSVSKSNVGKHCHLYGRHIALFGWRAGEYIRKASRNDCTDTESERALNGKVKSTFHSKSSH